MVVVEVRFPAGRYHATPWERDVNEGEVEWPPSPWRIVRALIATWHQKVDEEEVDRATLERLVVALGSELPEYCLPPAVAAHSRHYMPLYETHKGATRKIFDAFLRVAEEPLLIRWPDIDLDEEARSALGLLVSRLGYLGRAESWTEVRLVEDMQEFAPNCVTTNEPPGDDQIIVNVLALTDPEEYGSWREEMTETLKGSKLAEKREKARERGKDPAKKKLTKTNLRRIEEALPSSLYDAACTRTEVLQKQGWSRPPGTRWVSFVRPRVPVSAPARAVAAIPDTRFPTVARYALAGQVLPRMTEAVSIGERIHISLIANSDGHPVFTGRDEEGEPRGDHTHAYILPESHGKHGRITHVTVVAKMGFDQVARTALGRLGKRGIWGHGEDGIQCVLLGVGRSEDLAGWNVREGACDMLVESTRWRSRTPFVPTRYPKQRKSGEPKTRKGSIKVGDADPELLANVGIFGVGGGQVMIQKAGATDELLRFLELRGFSRPDRIVPITDTNLAGRRTRWLEFRTRRKKGWGRRGYGHGFGFEIGFSAPVIGPIALGYGAHFGLGRFEPVPDDLESGFD